jgi:Ser/Thr protein kinase RdoA (MazF antagonist)
MYGPIVEKVLAAYGIQPRKIHAPQKGYRNEIWPVELHDGTLVNLTFFKRENGIAQRVRRTDAVSEYVADHGLPARRRLDRRILQLKSGNGTILAGVYEYLPGRTIPWEAYTMDHLKLLGKAMSNMHALLKGMSDTNLPSVFDEYTDIFERMQRYFSAPQVSGAMRQKLNVMIVPGVLENALTLLRSPIAGSQQPLHMDFVRGNILFGGMALPELTLHKVRLSGILDFEKTALGSPVVDIARTLAFLLVDCKYKQPQKVYKYFLQSGYMKRGANTTPLDSELLEKYVNLFLLHDFYKFLRHNPYESLAANEHYVRTRDILHERNMVRYP